MSGVGALAPARGHQPLLHQHGQQQVQHPLLQAVSNDPAGTPPSWALPPRTSVGRGPGTSSTRSAHVTEDPQRVELTRLDVSPRSELAHFPRC